VGRGLPCKVFVAGAARVPAPSMDEVNRSKGEGISVPVLPAAGPHCAHCVCYLSMRTSEGSTDSLKVLCPLVQHCIAAGIV
jgi:hypothetical protein